MCARTSVEGYVREAVAVPCVGAVATARDSNAVKVAGDDIAAACAPAAAAAAATAAVPAAAITSAAATIPPATSAAHYAICQPAQRAAEFATACERPCVSRRRRRHDDQLPCARKHAARVPKISAALALAPAQPPHNAGHCTRQRNTPPPTHEPRRRNVAPTHACANELHQLGRKQEQGVLSGTQSVAEP
eukprot:366341-Chlamydomonas_euryale.AAC.20